MSSEIVDQFISEWKSASRAVDGQPRKRLYGDSLHVEISPSARTNTVRINSIKSINYGSGELKKLLTWLTKRASKHDIVLTLSAQSFGWNRDDLPSNDKLKEIVERYGFKLKFVYPDNDGYEMVKHPT